MRLQGVWNTTIAFNCVGCRGACGLCPKCVPTTTTYDLAILDDPSSKFQIIANTDMGSANNGGGSLYNSYLTSFVNSLSQKELSVFWDNPAIQTYLVSNLKEVPRLNYNPLLGGSPIMIIIDSKAVEFAKEFIQNVIESGLNLDFEKSLKSPANIDLSAINNNTPEGQKFNEVYNELVKVTAFKALFTDIFDGPQTRLNVKFEIHEHFYRVSSNGQSVEVAGNITSGSNQNDNTYIIKINKQGLISNGSIVQNKLENAQTIVHESVYAFLNHLFKNLNSIASISNIDQKNLKEILDALNAENPNQHAIMFSKLTETIAEILSSLKDVLTTPDQRAMVEDLMINESQDPLNPNPQPWNWDTYFTYLSYVGLQGTAGFNTQFPPNSDALNKFTLYITYGRAYLNL